MSRVALVEPGTLLGQNVRDGLGAAAVRHEVRLLSTAAEAEGTLTQVGDDVAMVHCLSQAELDGVDVVVLCGAAQQQTAALEMVASGTPVVMVADGPGALLETDGKTGQLAVAGVNDRATLDAPIIISPHPGVVLLSHLLAPLAALRPSRVTATLLLPTSMHNESGLDELFAQTRSILNFQGELPTEVFPAQLAFNLLPGPPAGAIGEQTAAVLGTGPKISVQLVQASVFHSLATSLYFEVEEPAEADAIRRALAASSYLEVVDASEALGPIDAAAREEILVGRIEPASGSPNGFWVWAVMDNLTRGGANNALELVERILAPDA